MRVTIARISNTNLMAVKKLLQQAVSEGDTELDLAEVKTVDSSAVSLVLSFIRQVQGKGKTPVIRSVPGDLIDLMKVYGVYSLVSPWVAASEK